MATLVELLQAAERDHDTLKSSLEAREPGSESAEAP